MNKVGKEIGIKEPNPQRRMTYKIKAFFCSFLFLLQVPFSLSAQPAVVLKEGVSAYSLGLHLHILEDKDKKLTIEDVTSLEMAGKFVPSRSEMPNFAFTDSAFWVKFHLKNEKETGENWLLELAYSHLDRIELYEPDGKGSFTVRKAGDSYPFFSRQIKYRNFLFYLTLPVGRTKTVYLRSESNGPLQIPLYVLSTTAFIQRNHEEQIGFGIYYGIMLIMILYNLFLFFSVRDKAYLFYVVFIACYLLIQVTYNGLAYEYIWPNSVWWSSVNVPFLICLAEFSLVVFNMSFLHSREQTPKLNKLLLFLIGFACVGMIISLLGWYSLSLKLAIALLIVLPPLVIAMAIICWLGGYRPARFYLIAWLAFLCGIVLLALRAISILPNVFITEYGIQIGAVMQVILLSLALADRIKTLGEEKEQLRDEFNKTLEREVREKIVEISEKYQELENANEQIIESIHYGEMIQRSLLPSQNVIDSYLDNYFIIYQPRDIVGGDIYLFEAFEDGYLIGVVDCTGHGVPGAFMTMIAFSAFNTITVDHPHDDPAGILKKLNLILASSLDQSRTTSLSNDGLDAGLCFVNTEDQTLVYAGANMPLVYIVDDDIHYLKGDRQSIGYKNPDLDYDFENYQVPFKPSTSIYLASDGITDQTGGSRSFSFGKSRFYALLKENYRKPFPEQKEVIFRSFKEYQGDNSRKDDITVVGFGFDILEKET